MILSIATFYSRAVSFDILALCACALAVNFLIDTAVVTAMLHSRLDNIFLIVLIIGLVSCGLCGLSISAILSILRRQPRTGGTNE